MSYSQNGQDLAVIELFEGELDLHFVELGAGNGVDLSNTLLLEQNYGWRGLLVEASPTIFETLKINRPKATHSNALLWYEAQQNLKFWLRNGWKSQILEEMMVSQPPESRKAYQELRRAGITGSIVELETDTLHNVLDHHFAPSYGAVIDFMSIDLEGSEEAVLAEFPFPNDEYSPRCMCIERPTRNLTKKLQDQGNYQIWGTLGEDTLFIHKESGLI